MKWINRWNSWISATQAAAGIWKRRDGGHFVRVRVKSPKTGQLIEVMKSLPEATLAEAVEWLDQERALIRAGAKRETAVRPRFGGYEVSLFEKKVALGEIVSAKGKEKWMDVLEQHLIPYFGDHYVDQIRRSDIEAWKVAIGTLVTKGKYAPTSANTWFAVLKVVVTTAVGELELERNPMLGVKPFSTAGHRTYTREQPNSLLPGEVPAFLECMRAEFPQHYAMVVLGFATGWRPSSLPPLRWRGTEADVDWDSGTVEVRRSHTRMQIVMNRTKTGVDTIVTLPDEVLDILRWHLRNLPPGPMADSDLLFPSETGGLRAASVLDKPFRAVVQKLGLTKRITPRAMRRTFNDLARAAEVKDVVTRSISGHLTEAMQHRYSTAAGEEQRRAISKVIELAGFRRTAEVVGTGGGHGAQNEKAG